MSLLENSIAFMLPYEFSPTVLLVCSGAAWLYVRGHAVTGVSQRLRESLFWLGLLLIYGVLQTRFDLYAQHMFFMHRLQHLILHHLAPFLIALAAPQAQLLAGVPEPIARCLILPLRNSRLLGALYRSIQQPLIAALLFIALIYLWLFPDVHFIAMLNLPLYNVMNWGMALDGLLFWWMVFNRRSVGSSAAHHFGGRIVLLFALMFPQIVIGSYLALSEQDLYAIYAVCGRAWPLSAQLDQQIGGLITWIPAAMMSIAGALVLLRRWTQEREQQEEGGETCRDFA